MPIAAALASVHYFNALADPAGADAAKIYKRSANPTNIAQFLGALKK